MSFMDVLKGFGGWVAKEWTKIFNATPKIEHIADTVFQYVVPALQIVLGVLAPEEAAIAAPIIAEIQKDVTVASGLVYDFGANPTTSNIVAAIEGKLNDLLAAGHIKNADVVAKVQLITKTVGTLATALKN